MSGEARQLESDEQLASWLHQLDEQQAMLNHWKVGADKLDGPKRKEILTHIHSVESKIEQVRGVLLGSRASQSQNHSKPSSGDVASAADEPGRKETFTQGISRALGDLSGALRKASERLSKQ